MAKTPTELAEQYARAFNERRLEAILALYEPEAVLTRPGREVRGLAAIEEEFQRTLESRRGVKLHLRGVQSHAVGGLCLTVSSWDVDIDEQNSVSRYKAETIEVSRQQTDGTWKYVIDDPVSLRRPRPAN